MPQVGRAWIAFASIGAGLLHVALVISSPLFVGILLLILGTAELAWGAAVLSQDRFVAAQLARIGSLLPVLLWATMMLIDGWFGAPQLAEALTFVPMAVATVFDLTIATSVSIVLRRRSGASVRPPSGRPLGAWTYLGTLFCGAMLVAMLTTPALALTQAGLDNPHAEHRETAPTLKLERDEGHGH
ncbi:MAG: hypothetical protein JWP30_2145 [Homoserinimonas sp.]|jgi:hypothetical protein|nr:hypothetical protein [Homoserinimonas sp.]